MTTGVATADDRRWYVISCRPRKELFARFHVQARGVEVYFPQLRLPEYLERTRRNRVVPLFPGYLFVRIDLSTHFYAVLWSPGVKRFVGSSGVPTAVEDRIVNFLMSHATSDGILPARSDLRVGQEVEITGGPFDGIAGIIENPPDGRGRVKVLMSLLNRKVVKVRVPVQFVKGGWIA